MQLTRQVDATGSYAQFEFKVIRELGDMLNEQDNSDANRNDSSLWTTALGPAKRIGSTPLLLILVPVRNSEHIQDGVEAKGRYRLLCGLLHERLGPESNAQASHAQHG